MHLYNRINKEELKQRLAEENFQRLTISLYRYDLASYARCSSLNATSVQDRWSALQTPHNYQIDRIDCTLELIAGLVLLRTCNTALVS